MRSALVALSPQIAAPVLGRRAAALILAASVLAAVALAVLALGGSASSGPLRWSGDGEVFTHPTLPGDRVLTGTLRNEGLQAMRIDLADVRVVDGDGEVVASTPVFLRAFGKSLWGGGRGPEQVPDTELQRTGRIALLAPGEEVPLTVAWHAEDGDPERVDYGRGSLSLPG
jgi:hypothetical protein